MNLKVEIVRRWDEGLIKELVEMEHAAFPPIMWNGDEAGYYRDMLGQKSTINAVMRVDNGVIAGYLGAMPLVDAYRHLKNHDRNITAAANCIYVDTIMTTPGRRVHGGWCAMIDVMLDEAGRRGMHHFALHARRSNGFSSKVREAYPEVRLVRIIENWYGYGEPFDYLEATFVKTAAVPALPRSVHSA